ncbi:MAG: TolC family protein [Ilyomonas sp.]
MKAKQNILFILLSMLFSTAKAQKDSVGQRHEFSLQQCVEYAQKNNAQLKNTILDLRIQEQDNKAITAQALPAVNGSGNITDYVKIPTTLLPGEFFGEPGKYIPVTFGTKYNATASVTLRQIIFDGQVFVGLQARKTSIDYYQKNIDITNETIKANIYKVYYQLVVSKTQIEQLNANIERLQNLLHVTSELYKNGFAEKIDVDRTNVQLANLQTEKSGVVNSINNGYLGLKLLLGMSEQDTLILTDEITEDEVKQGLLNDGYQYNDRNDFQLLQLGKKLNEYNIKRYKLSALPTLSFDAAYTKQAQRTKFDIFGPGNWFTTSYVGLNLSVPIFNGLSKAATIEKSKLQLQQTQNQIEALKISIDNDVKQAINNFQTAISNLDYQKQNMQLAEQVYNQAQKKYEAGTGAQIDITNAQTDLRVAQSNYTNALYNAIIAKVDYLKATGKL